MIMFGMRPIGGGVWVCDEWEVEVIIGGARGWGVDFTSAMKMSCMINTEEFAFYMKRRL